MAQAYQALLGRFCRLVAQWLIIKYIIPVGTVLYCTYCLSLVDKITLSAARAALLVRFYSSLNLLLCSTSTSFYPWYCTSTLTATVQALLEWMHTLC